MRAIQTSSLSRHFGEIVAVDGLDLAIREGEIYGFLGPNGAGKSTTINMLLGFTRPSSGSGTILGHDIEEESLEIRESIGVLPEDFGMYNRLTAREHVQFAIDVKESGDDAGDLLDRVGLIEAADRKAGGFSTGMKQRTALAMALVGDPDLLILDEPSSGLDPNGAREMRTIIREENERGATIFFSSHIMEQVEAICDRVGIMREGRLVAEDTIQALKAQFDADSQLIVTVDAVQPTALSELEALEGVVDVSVDGTTIAVSLTEASRKAVVINTIEENGSIVTDITTQESSLEDLFAAITGDTHTVTETTEPPRSPESIEGVDA